MLRHIAANYHLLPEVTIFLQGWPFKHCHNIAKAVRNAVNKLLLSKDVKNAAWANFQAPEVIPISTTMYSYDVLRGVLGTAVDMMRSQSAPGTSEEKVRNATAKAYQDMCASMVDRGSLCPHVQLVAEGAQWAALRSGIRKQPVEFYQKAAEVGEGAFGELRGLVLEAIWPVLWAHPRWFESFVPSTSLMSQKSSIRPQSFVLNQDCLADNTALVHSCDTRMAACEFQWMEERQSPSKDFVQNRRLYQIAGSPTAQGWSMNVTIVKPKIFGPTESFVVNAWTLGVELKEGSGVPWFVISTKAGLLFKAVLPTIGDVYLGCKRGSASVSTRKQRWHVKRHRNSLLALKTVGASLWLAPGRKHIHCSQRVAPINMKVLPQ